MFHGADTAAIAGLETDLDALIARYDQALARDTHFIDQLTNLWRGPFASLFIAAWTTVDRIILRTAHHTLTELRQHLTTNRNEQDQASQATTSPMRVANESSKVVDGIGSRRSPNGRIYSTKRTLNAAMDGWGTNEDAIMDALADLTPPEQAALRNDSDLMNRLNGELDRSDMLRAMRLLDVDPSVQLAEAMNDFGTDESGIRQALRNASAQEKADIRNDPALMARLDRELSDADMAEVNRLLDPDAVRLHFNGEQLVAVNATTGEEIDRWSGVSGKPGSTPAAQVVEDYGPIPEGRWEVDPASLSRRDDSEYWSKRSFRSWGDGRAKIAPKPWTDTMRRDLLRIHGGTDPGSIGCIDLTGDNPAFMDWLDSQTAPIELVVDYPAFGVDYGDGRD